jgi:succinate dehydrogenase / fumarate reductase membrane anchor subunit
MSSIRTPLARARHLGSAKTGTDHFWRQRLTATALVPLAILIVGVVIAAARADYRSAVLFVGSPPVAILVLLFVVAAFWHLKLGLQVVIEDYVHGNGARVTLLVLNTLVCAALGIACAYSVLKLAIGAVAP